MSTSHQALRILKIILGLSNLANSVSAFSYIRQISIIIEYYCALKKTRDREDTENIVIQAA